MLLRYHQNVLNRSTFNEEKPITRIGHRLRRTDGRLAVMNYIVRSAN
jgi:hypothetical protein